MIDERPDPTGIPRPSQKLILPGPDTFYPPPDQQTQRGYALPEHVAHSRPMPTPAIPPYPLRKRNWRNDPAYIVLLIAIATVLVAGIAFAAVASTMFFSGTEQRATTAPKTVTTSQGTVDTHPMFPTPGGKRDGTTGSQFSPTATPTTPVQPTPTQIVPLTVQINNPPTQVSNNTVVPISVTTSEPNTSVRLIVIYSASPYFASVGPQMTDENGNATISWPVAVRASERHHTVTARILVTCGEQHKKGALSQTFLVQIMTRGIILGD